MKQYLLALCTAFVAQLVCAAPSQFTPFIRLDQFGYLPNARKVAVIADPQTGFNATDSYTPGATMQVRVLATDEVVFTGSVVAWNNGTTHAQSGDRGWSFDFSAVTTPGTYYLYDVSTNRGSYTFEIGDQVYANALKHAVRTYYYQRCNFAKQAPYTDARWADGAWYEGSNQDRFATSRFSKGNMSTARDLHGGWIDAGDQNKYTTFAESAVIQLLEAYRLNPQAFADNYEIPESGNGIADILDEVKYELDFLKRMQDATGTNGFLLKVGVDNYDVYNPISTDTRPRYYLPECTSATLSGASMFAVAANVFKSVPALAAYATDLTARAEAAWQRAKSTTSNFTSFQAACDDGDIKSGDADKDAQAQLESAFVTAVYLYEATGLAEYKTFAESNYTRVNPYRINWWGPYWAPQQLALLRLTTLPNVNATVASNIRNQKAGMNYLYSINQYNANTDLYRGYMADDAYHWGHHQARASAGAYNMDFISFNINTANHAGYREVAEQYLHWFHGVNPMGIVMLSNMYGHGGDSCVNEIYHAWYDNNTIWDNAKTSAKGPAPGYVPGGPNRQYTGTVPNITNQPVQKAYKDWNTGYPENSWEITEPSIYCQAAYVMLLSRIMPAAGPPPPPDTEAPTAPTNLTVTSVGETTASLSWTAATDNVAVTAYRVYRNNTQVATVSATTYNDAQLTCNTAYNYYVVAVDAAGNGSANSNTVNATTAACAPAPSSQIIYADAIGSGWSDVSSGVTRNLVNTNPVKAGTYSLKADIQVNGTLAFSASSVLTTTSTTELRFWVYANGGYNLGIYTEAVDGSQQSAVASRKTSRNKWVEIVLNRSAFGSPASIKRVVFKNTGRSAINVYFDDIRLTNVIAPQPQSAPAMAAAKKTTESAFLQLNVSPNPVVNELTLRIKSARGGDAIVQVVGSEGRVKAQLITVLIAGENTKRINLSALNKGVYHVVVQQGNERSVKAIMKE